MRDNRTPAADDGILEAISPYCGVRLDTYLCSDKGVGQNHGTGANYSASFNVDIVRDHRLLVDAGSRTDEGLQAFEVAVLGRRRERRVEKVMRIALDDECGIAVRQATAQIG